MSEGVAGVSGHQQALAGISNAISHLLVFIMPLVVHRCQHVSAGIGNAVSCPQVSAGVRSPELKAGSTSSVEGQKGSLRGQRERGQRQSGA